MLAELRRELNKAVQRKVEFFFVVEAGVLGPEL